MELAKLAPFFYGVLRFKSRKILKVLQSNTFNIFLGASRCHLIINVYTEKLYV